MNRHYIPVIGWPIFLKIVKLNLVFFNNFDILLFVFLLDILFYQFNVNPNSIERRDQKLSNYAFLALNR